MLLARECPGVRRKLDRWLDQELRPLAARYEGRSVFELAATWGTDRDPLQGHTSRACNAAPPKR